MLATDSAAQRRPIRSHPPAGPPARPREKNSPARDRPHRQTNGLLRRAGWARRGQPCSKKRSGHRPRPPPHVRSAQHPDSTARWSAARANGTATPLQRRLNPGGVPRKGPNPAQWCFHTGRRGRPAPEWRSIARRHASRCAAANSPPQPKMWPRSERSFPRPVSFAVRADTLIAPRSQPFGL